ncbi:MAG: ATP-binding protein [Candidatus Acidiferrales bacterium]
MLTDNEIIARLAPSEDHFVERKTQGDKRDWVKTVVAFANSCPPGYPGLLLIGVRDDGSIEGGANLDSMQKTLNELLKDAYPSIYVLPKVVTHQGQPFLAVIVPGSDLRPHFSGASYVRLGSQTIKASAEQFERLIAQRTSKAYTLGQHIDELITVEMRRVEHTHVGETQGEWAGKIVDFNKDFVVIESTSNPAFRSCFPLERILLGIDSPRNRFKVEVYPVPVSRV